MRQVVIVRLLDSFYRISEKRKQSGLFELALNDFYWQVVERVTVTLPR